MIFAAGDVRLVLKPDALLKGTIIAFFGQI